MRPEASNLRRWAWRVPLIVAVLAMLFAAALVSGHERYLTFAVTPLVSSCPDLDAHRQGSKYELAFTVPACNSAHACCMPESPYPDPDVEVDRGGQQFHGWHGRDRARTY